MKRFPPAPQKGLPPPLVSFCLSAHRYGWIRESRYEFYNILAWARHSHEASREIRCKFYNFRAWSPIQSSSWAFIIKRDENNNGDYNYMFYDCILSGMIDLCNVYYSADKSALFITIALHLLLYSRNCSYIYLSHLGYINSSDIFTHPSRGKDPPVEKQHPAPTFLFLNVLNVLKCKFELCACLHPLTFFNPPSPPFRIPRNKPDQ